MSSMGRTFTGLAWLAAIAIACAPARAQTLTADQAVKMALEHNTQVIDALATVYSAKGSLYSAYSGVLPHLSAGLTRSGTWTRNKGGVQLFGTFQSPIPEKTESYSTTPGFTGTWNLIDLSSLTSLKAARSGLEGAEWQHRAARNDVALAARRQFYEVVKAVKLAGVSDEALQLARDNEKRVRALFEVGSVARSDVLRQQVQTTQAVLDSITAQQGVLVQRANLAGLIGVEESRMGEVDTVLTVSAVPFEEAGLLAEATAERPDLKAAELQLRSARSGVTSARLMRLPYVTLSGSATYNPFSTSSSHYRIADSLGVVRALDTYSRNESEHQYAARVALNWDFFDGLATDARNAGARANLLRAQDTYDVLRRNLQSEVHEAFVTYQQALAGETTARTAVESAQENVKLIQQKYNVGSATILDLIDAQVQLSRAESQEVSALAAIRQAEAQVQRARGHSE